MVLEVNGISKTLSGRPVLNNVSFSVESGEILGFIGPNGAGKTTAIKVILGLLHANSGSVSIMGNDIVKNHEAALASVGAIIESPELYSYMSGYDNLMQFARIHNIGEERVMECARIVGLGDRIRDKVSRYSLGMRQRLGVAQAIMHNPKLLILDEPTNGLDPSGILDLRSTLRRLAFEEGTAILVSSHLLSELEHICTSVCVIEKGNIISYRKLSEGEVEEKPITYILTVGDNEKAVSVLSSSGYSATVGEDGNITLSVLKSSVPRAVAALVGAECDIYGLTEKKLTLEDAYIEATGNTGAQWR